MSSLSIHNISRTSRILFPSSIRFSSSSSSTTHRFPFPQHPHPTPHQIFHLPHGASQQDIKARCTTFHPTLPTLPLTTTTHTDYDLVKVYHPDAPSSSSTSSSQTRHAQFQAIKHAYDVLRGKATSHAHLRPRTTTDTWNDRVYEELERRRRGGASSPGQAAASAAAGRKYNSMDNLMITFAVVVRPLF